MADTGQSVCDCVQNTPCFQEWFRSRWPHGCCGCCEGTGCGGDCNYTWEDGYYWHLSSENCSGGTINAGQGWLVCRCAVALHPPDWPHVEGQDTLLVPCQYAYVIALYLKGKGLLGVNRDALKYLRGGQVAPKQNCGSCGSHARQQATTNEVRKEALATTPRRKLF